MWCCPWLSFQKLNYQEELTFVLNDICACTLARAVLILYMLLKGKILFIASVAVFPFDLIDYNRPL